MKKKDLLVLVFSKDRALQLDCCLRSLFENVDFGDLNWKCEVLYTASAERFHRQYKVLISDYESITWTLQSNFKQDVVSCLRSAQRVLFLVDDTVFWRKVSIHNLVKALDHCEKALGFSLRLGKNTTYCYPFDKEQSLPDFQKASEGVFRFRWSDQDFDFSYPLEVSSSIYSSRLIDSIVEKSETLLNPNELEHHLAQNSHTLSGSLPELLCLEESVSFSVPLNLVQSSAENRNLQDRIYSVRALAGHFDRGYRLKYTFDSSFKPNSAHCLVEPQFWELANHQTDVGKISKPIVSVIVPCYNYGKYVGEAVDSVRAQTLSGVEIIVVDGGSDEETIRVLEHLQSEGITVYFRKGRHMVGSNRNYGIERAKSELICCLDADDKLAPTYLEKALFVLRHFDCDVVGAVAESFGKESKLMGVNEVPINQDILNVNEIMSASLTRKEIWKAVGGYEDFGLGEDYVYEDWHYWCKVALAGAKFRNLTEPLIHYRVHEKVSLSNQWGQVKGNEEQRKAVQQALEGLDINPINSTREDIGPGLFESKGTSAAIGVLINVASSEMLFQVEALLREIRQNGFDPHIIVTDTEDLEQPVRRILDDEWWPVEGIRLQWISRELDAQMAYLQWITASRGIRFFVDVNSSWVKSHRKQFLDLLKTNLINLSQLSFTSEVGRGREFLFDETMSSGEPIVMEKVRIKALGRQSQGSKGSEVWILDVLDPEARSLMVPELKSLLPTGWEIKKVPDSDRGMALLAISSGDFELSIPQGSAITFLKHDYSGLVEVENLSRGQKRVYDLHSEGADRLSLSIYPLPEGEVAVEDAISGTSDEEWVTISLDKENWSHAKSSGNEVVLLSMRDSNNRVLTDYSIESMGSWVLSPLIDGGFKLLAKEGDSLELKVPLSAQLQFERNPGAGSLTCSLNDKTERIELFHPEYSEYSVGLETIFEI